VRLSLLLDAFLHAPPQVLHAPGQAVTHQLELLEAEQARTALRRCGIAG